MKKRILVGIAVTGMACSAMAEETKVSRTVVVSGNAGAPHIVFSTNITTKIVTHVSGGSSTNMTTQIFSSPGGEGVANVQVKIFNANGEDITSSKGFGTEEKVTWLGVTTEAVDDVVRSQVALDPEVGLAVYGVSPDSPAAKAGVLKHDILVRFNDQLLMEPGQLSKLVKSKKPGDRVKLTYLRKGKESKVDVTLDEHTIVDAGNLQVLDLGDMGGTLNIDAAELLKGVKLSDSNLNVMIEAAVKAMEKNKAEK